MHLLTIIWTLICAAVIIGYPLYLLNKSVSLTKILQDDYKPMAPNTVELLSFDIREQLPSWSLSIEAPHITEEVLHKNPILFYLESEDTCFKLPLNNAAMGYKASVYKNVGKVYVTFKSLKDGVSHFHIPTYHLKNLKILIIKFSDERIYGNWGASPNNYTIHKSLEKAGINIHDFEDVLGHLSNIASIDFKGHYVAKMPQRKKVRTVTRPMEQINKERLFATT
ncbi:hypothetical protein GO009_14495 [Muricauda sp. TY007]|uniref:hypothetical protein n=1 Tax=Allomuricauda sp. TY007 TaxID=2683200 RepID=UPI0013BFE79A|nr:hypothetical protein [Muricauda sp. TY007]NDV17231.1 hypothetical protein [Muricauda sp. TY007]